MKEKEPKDNVVQLFEEEKKGLHCYMEDKAISWSAKGVLAYLLTRAGADNRFTVKELVEAGRLGRAGIFTIMHELESEGYILRFDVRYENGTFGGTQWSLNCYEH